MPSFEVYVTPNTTQWQVQVDFAGEATTDVDVGVVCSRIRASNFFCDPDAIFGNMTYLNSSCRGYADSPVNNNSTEWFAATADYFRSAWKTRFGAAP